VCERERERERTTSIFWQFPLPLSLRHYVVTLRLYISGFDRLCGLVVRVSGFRSRGPVTIPGATRFSEK
jgi:hypothetical protein